MESITEEQHLNYHRKDDSFMRKMVGAVFVAMIGQGIFSIYYAGQLTNQVSNNTKAIAHFAENQDNQNGLAIQLAEIKTTVNLLVATVDRATDKLDIVSTKQSLFSDKLSSVAEEQKKRTDLVYGNKKK